MPSRSACTTRAGQRFAVRRLESGNRTKTTSPRRQFIVDSHLWAIPVFRESTQAVPKIGSLRRIDAESIKFHALCALNPRHNYTRTLCLIRQVRQFDFPVPVNAFQRCSHACIVSQNYTLEKHVHIEFGTFLPTESITCPNPRPIPATTPAPIKLRNPTPGPPGTTHSTKRKIIHANHPNPGHPTTQPQPRPPTAKHPKTHFHQTNPANLIQYKEHHPTTTPGFPRVFHPKIDPFAGFSPPNPGTQSHLTPLHSPLTHPPSKCLNIHLPE